MNGTLSTTESSREQRCRRRAALQGLHVTKARIELYEGFGRYVVSDHRSILVSSEYGMDLEELERFLADEDVAS